MIRNKTVTRGAVECPCGRCAACISRRVSNWSFRLMQEEKISLSAYFITLTYDCENVPITKNGFMDLSKRHIQLFFKRVRKQHCSYGKFGVPLKYYAVGEYGGRFKRPHYHILCFNWELELLVGPKLFGNIERGIIQLDGKRPFTCSSWPQGHITIGKVSGASVGYTMKYVSKPWRPMHMNDDRTPQFPLMSKGLGESYLTAAMIKWHQSDLYKRQYCTTLDGKKISMPRYYKLKIASIQEKENIRAFNVLESMRPVKRENSARQRSESYFAGLERIKSDYLKNQKF